MRLMPSKARIAPSCLSAKRPVFAALAACLWLFPWKSRGQEGTLPAAFHPAGLYNPVANPKAVVILGHVRFTVLTSKLVRMEWAANGQFENLASFVFLNRDDSGFTVGAGDCGREAFFTSVAAATEE